MGNVQHASKEQTATQEGDLVENGLCLSVLADFHSLTLTFVKRCDVAYVCCYATLARCPTLPHTRVHVLFVSFSLYQT